MDMMGVIGSNCLINDVADTPSNFGITISYHDHATNISSRPPKQTSHTHHQYQIVLFQIHLIDRADAIDRYIDRASEHLQELAR